MPGDRDDDFRSWERLGTVRRDYEPHRGPLLLSLGVSALLCGILSTYLAGVALAEPAARELSLIAAALNLPGLGVGAWVRKAVARDRREMRRGEMDRSGERQALQSGGPALGALILNGGLLPVSVGCCLLLGRLAVTDCERVRLLFGPYKGPPLKPGDRAFCLYRDATVIITGRADAPIPWARCRALDSPGAGSGLLVDEELARAVRHEAAASWPSGGRQPVVGVPLARGAGRHAHRERGDRPPRTSGGRAGRRRVARPGAAPGAAAAPRRAGNTALTPMLRTSYRGANCR
jgi:hypothetical protein